MFIKQKLYGFLSCSLSATHQHICDNTVQSSVHPACCQNYTKVTFHWKFFIKGSLLSIKIHRKNVNTHTATHLQVTPEHPEPSATLHKDIQSTKWRNNTRQQYGSVLFTMGFHSEKCLEFQNTTSFLQYMTFTENGSLSLIGLFYLFHHCSFLPLSLCRPSVSLKSTQALVCACMYKHASPCTLHSGLIHIHPLCEPQSRLVLLLV